MAYVVHPKYKVWVGALENSIRDTLESAFPAIFNQSLGALTPHQQERLKIKIRQAALQAWQGFFSVCKDYRKNEWKKSKKLRRKKAS